MMLMMMQRLLFLLILVVLCVGVVSAHESCCSQKLQAAERALAAENEEEPEFLFLAPSEDDEEDGPKPRLIPDPTSRKPDDWDDEDDGPWAAKLIVNPEYQEAIKIPNPRYVRKASYREKLQIEVLSSLPWVTLGVLFAALLALLPLDNFLQRQFLSQRGQGSDGGSTTLATTATTTTAWVKAALLGLCSPLCSCGSLPVAAGLGSASLPAAVAFLTASQSAGLDSAVITYGVLGGEAALGRLCGALILAVAAAAAASGGGGGDGRVGSREEQTKKSSSSCPSPPTVMRCASIIATVLDLAVDIFPVVLAGLVASTAAVHWLPSLLASYTVLKQHTTTTTTFPLLLLLRLAVLTSAVPLQLCEHTTVVLAAGMRGAGASPGLAFAFLLSAPATNMPTLLWVQRQKTSSGSSWMVVGRVVVALVGTALAVSYLVDLAGVDMLLQPAAAGEMAVLPAWWVALSPWVAVVLTVSGLIQKQGRIKEDMLCETACPCGDSKNKQE